MGTLSPKPNLPDSLDGLPPGNHMEEFEPLQYGYGFKVQRFQGVILLLHTGTKLGMLYFGRLHCCGQNLELPGAGVLEFMHAGFVQQASDAWSKKPHQSKEGLSSTSPVIWLWKFKWSHQFAYVIVCTSIPTQTPQRHPNRQNRGALDQGSGRENLT